VLFVAVVALFAVSDVQVSITAVQRNGGVDPRLSITRIDEGDSWCPRAIAIRRIAPAIDENVPRVAPNLPGTSLLTGVTRRDQAAQRDPRLIPTTQGHRLPAS
jgi:hypothetical protein